jgi:hypothetical protein
MNLNFNLRFKVCAPAILLALSGAVAAAQQPHTNTNTVDPKSFEAFKIVTDRNIFDASRTAPRPFVVRERPPVVDSFALAGTMSYGKGLFAFFDGNKSDYHVALETGGKIAGYTVNEICHDSVKMSVGTNQVELKVGMHMQRSEDGKWASTERGGDLSFNSNNFRTRNTGRNGNGNGNERPGRFGFNRNNCRNDRSFGGNNNVGVSMGGVNFGGNNNGVRETTGAGTDSTEAAPAVDMSNLNPNDPVQRLILRRMQEAGGNPNQNNNDGQYNDQNTTGDNPNGNQTGEVIISSPGAVIVVPNGNDNSQDGNQNRENRGPNNP